MNNTDQIKVMLVDDNEIDLFLNAKFMQVSGVTEDVISFSKPREGLDYLEENAANDENLPSIILLDIVMPELTGFQFLERFEEMSESLQKNIAIIMLSSTVDPIDLERAEKNRFVTGILKKPLNPDVLKSIIKDSLARIAA